jgi:uncharacterized protein
MYNLQDLEKIVSGQSYKIIKDKIDKTLVKYLLENIMPIYNTLDKGHGINHIGTVIDSSMKLSECFGINSNMVFTVAIYHDLGMSIDRKIHEKHSKIMLTENKDLKNWFSEEEIIKMGEACEDHRASNKIEPRSIYGYLISDADRTTDIEDMIIRCYNFSIKNYKDKNEEDLYNRVYAHLKEKYGEGGYAKFYLKESQEIIMKPYIEAQKILEDEEVFKKIYLKVVN